MIDCCKGCTERVVGCHSHCTKYIEQRKAHVEKAQEIRRARKQEYEWRCFNKDSRLEVIKQKQIRDGRRK